MPSRIISILMCACFFCMPVVSLADEVTSYKQGWYDGYRAGHADENVDWTASISKYRDLADSIFDYRKLLLEGKVKPIMATTEFARSVKSDGSIEYTQKVVIKPVESGDFAPVDFLKERIKKADESLAVSTGWWVSVETDKLSSEDKGFLKFIAMQNGFQPRIFKDRLIFSIERNHGDALRVADRLAKYKISAEVAYVEVR